jgi:hypothetical protein
MSTTGPAARRKRRNTSGADGQGGNPPPAGQTLLPYGGATVRTSSIYDGNGRVTQLIDDRGTSPATPTTRSTA